MKAASSRISANRGCRRTIGRYLSRIDNTPLPNYRPEALENHVSSMMLGRASEFQVETCEAQISAAQAGKIRLTALSRGHYPGPILSNGTLPGVSSTGFWDGTGPQDWGVAPQRNGGLEIRFIETGNLGFLLDDQQFDLTAGDLVMTRPWQLHQLGNPYVGRGRVHWLTIDLGVRNPNDLWRWPDWLMLTPSDLAELTQKLRRNKMPVFKSTPEITRIFQQMATCIVQWNNPHSVSRMTVWLNQLFVSFLDVSVTQGHRDISIPNLKRQAVEALLKGLQDNPRNCEDISSLEQMAERCGMGITAFARHTRDFANVGPMEFLKQCRLNHAARQLRERPGVSITDVCFSNGFNSSQYFATCFRKQFKMSPSEFVSRQRELR